MYANRNYRKIIVFYLFIGCFVLVQAPRISAQEVVATIEIPGFPEPTNYAIVDEVAFDPVHNRLYVPFTYVPNAHLGYVAVIDAETYTVMTHIPVDRAPWDAEFIPIHNRVYVSNQGGNGVSVIDTETNTVIKTIIPPSGPYNTGMITFNPENNLVYVAGEVSYDIWVIDAETDSFLAKYYVGVYRPAFLEINPAANKLYIGNNSGNHLIVFDTLNNIVSNTIPVIAGHMDLDLVNNRLYIEDSTNKYVHVLDLATEAVTDSIPFEPPHVPRGALYNMNTNKIFVPKAYSQTTDVFDAATLQLIKTLPGGNSGMALNPAANRIYVTERSCVFDDDEYRPGKIHVIQDISNVAIDIKPFNRRNVIWLWKWGIVSVAILSADDFDAPEEIDKTSITFGRTGDEQSLAYSHRWWHWDVNRDGLPDLICYFWTEKTGFQVGDTEGILKAQTNAGLYVEGRDMVKIKKIGN